MCVCLFVCSFANVVNTAPYQPLHTLTTTIPPPRPPPKNNTNTPTHTHTQVACDCGFMVFNHQNYPNMVELFAELGVEDEVSGCEDGRGGV